jgi:hypothetical protein
LSPGIPLKHCSPNRPHERRRLLAVPARPTSVYGAWSWYAHGRADPGLSRSRQQNTSTRETQKRDTEEGHKRETQKSIDNRLDHRLRTSSGVDSDPGHHFDWRQNEPGLGPADARGYRHECDPLLHLFSWQLLQWRKRGDRGYRRVIREPPQPSASGGLRRPLLPTRHRATSIEHMGAC